MTNSNVAVVLAIAVAVAMGGTMLALTHLLGRPKKSQVDRTPYECGSRPFQSMDRQRFSVKFYLVAMLFVLFDLEAVFFYPWGALFRDLGFYGYVVMSIFTVFPLVIGLLYEWRKGALEW